MGFFLTIYTISWVLFCLFALIMYLRERGLYVLSYKEYWRSILKPWKIVTFLVAAISFMVMAPYTGDPTWDAFDAGFMSVFTFATAPWAVGSLYRMMAGRLPVRQFPVIVAVWMFTVSWSYDIYIFLRDGIYPITWLSNIAASSLLYFLAGILWNIDWKEGNGVVLSFREEVWPCVSSARVFGKIVWFALPVMLLVAAMILYFFFFYLYKR